MALIRTADIRKMSVEERDKKLRELRDELMHERERPPWAVHPQTPGRSGPSGPISLGS